MSEKVELKCGPQSGKHVGWGLSTGGSHGGAQGVGGSQDVAQEGGGGSQGAARGGGGLLTNGGVVAGSSVPEERRPLAWPITPTRLRC